MDLTILAALNSLAGKSTLLNGLLVFLAQYAVYLLAFPLLALALGIGLNHPDRMTVVVSLLGLAVSLLVARQIGHTISGTRPFVTESWVVQLVGHKADSGLPSNHATGAFALAAGVLWSHRRTGAAMLALALLVAIGRVAVGVHWPSQVLLGALLGVMVASLAHALVQLGMRDRQRRAKAYPHTPGVA